MSNNSISSNYCRIQVRRDPREIMMEMTGFQDRLGLRTKQERTLYSSPLGY